MSRKTMALVKIINNHHFFPILLKICNQHQHGSHFGTEKILIKVKITINVAI